VRICLSLFVFILVFPCALHPASLESKIKNLDEKAKVADTKRAAEEKNLSSINLKLSSMEKEISNLKKVIGERRIKIIETSNLIILYDSELRKNQEIMRDKLIDLYKAQSVDSLESPSGRSNLAPYAAVSIYANIQEADRYRHMKELKEEAKSSLEREEAALKSDMKKLDKKVSELGVEKKKKNDLIASLKKESRTYKSEIERLMRQLTQRKKSELIIPGTGLAKLKGKLPWPVKGKVVQGFGRHKETGILQISQGIDIKAQPGERVKCIYKGKVVYSGWLDVFGNTLIIDHGNGFHSVYGFLQKVVKSAGQDVAENEYIAVTGEDVTPPGANLHFEIRYKGNALDPLDWLQGR
jgi:septal ring factor EnvC (AmiA/AmiB activator)